MTSEEIKYILDNISGDPNVESLKMAATFEIAFQLAKLNEHFEMVDGAVFGGTNAKKEKEK